MNTKIYEELSDLFPLWRETTLGKKGHEKEEANFVIDVFNKYPSEIKSVIDLGGGVGLHSNLLSNAGYDVTLFDKSEKALSIGKQNNSNLKTVQGDFESIAIDGSFDASICMWSTLSYVYSEEGRKNFYAWQKEHTNKVIILDEANFYRYPETFHREYFGENERYTMKVTRDWDLKDTTKNTKFIYEIADKETGKTETIEDAEKEQYVPVEKIQEYLGSEWKLEYLLGDYDLNTKFDKENSSRIIAVFFK